MKDKQIQHLGIIMDGNRRWAKSHGKSSMEGHEAGYQILKKILKHLKKSSIDFITIYSFSSENWSRSKTEVNGLLGLLKWVLENELDELIAEETKIIFIGREEGLPQNLLKLMRKTEELSKHHKRTLAICFNYGGKQEIADAANAAAKQGEITPESIEQNLYADEIPACDLIIRTSGEQRLSNFMLWRAAYSEFAFTDTLWPDFTVDELDEILDNYIQRQRRFGA